MTDPRAVTSLATLAGDVELEVDGRQVHLTNLERVYWPETGFTKAQTLDYYLRIAPALLPHIRDRPMTLRRFPEGVGGLNWFQAQCRGAPEWLPTHTIHGQRGQIFHYCLVNDVPSLLWAANLGTIEFHPFPWTVDRPPQPSALVLDLDPGPPAWLLEAAALALRLRAELATLALPAWIKTSGSLGLHLYVPLEPGQGFEAAKAFARQLADVFAYREPDRVTAEMRRGDRPGRVYIDWLQNVGSRSTVAPYSLRASHWPTVSTPLEWHEVEDAVNTGRAELLLFGPSQALARVAERGDLFEPVLGRGARLPPPEVLVP
jgi:bifunctional non-homologous end joining protein LigD